jgi:hypothetical protein
MWVCGCCGCRTFTHTVLTVFDHIASHPPTLPLHLLHFLHLQVLLDQDTGTVSIAPARASAALGPASASTSASASGVAAATAVTANSDSRFDDFVSDPDAYGSLSAGSPWSGAGSPHSSTDSPCSAGSPDSVFSPDAAFADEQGWYSAGSGEEAPHHAIAIAPGQMTFDAASVSDAATATTTAAAAQEEGEEEGEEGPECDYYNNHYFVGPFEYAAPFDY